jgi:superfamily II DNA or RNA helicase
MITIRVGHATSRIEDGVLPFAVTNAISEACSYQVENAEFMKRNNAMKYGPRYGKMANWDGMKRLYHKGFRTFPSGLLPRVEYILTANHIEYNTEYNTKPWAAWRTYTTDLSGFEQRGYQEEAVRVIMETGRCMVKVATGGGKTYIAARVIAECGMPTIFLVHTKDLMYQAHDVFAKIFGEDRVGLIGDAHCEPNDITICTIQTAALALKADYEKYAYSEDEDDEAKMDDAKIPQVVQTIQSAGVVIMDECISGDTLVTTDVGAVPIRDIVESGVGTSVLTMHDGVLVNRKILRRIKRGVQNIIEIGNLSCTRDHPIYVQDKGYVNANKVLGELVRTMRDEAIEQLILGSGLGDGSFDALPSGKKRMRFVHGPNQKEYIHAKERTIRAMVGTGVQSRRNAGFGNTTLWFNTKCDKLFDRLPINVARKPTAEWLDALDSRGLAWWFMDDGSNNGRGTVISIHTEGFDEESVDLIVSWFYSHHGVIWTKTRTKNKYWRLDATGRDNIDRFTRIVGPHIIESMRYKILGCADGGERLDIGGPVALLRASVLDAGRREHVYDLEVEQTHSFFAGNILVHNCHRVAAPTATNVLSAIDNAMYRIGLSASPWRDDGADLVLEAVFGQVVVDISASTLINMGYLVRPYIKFVPVPPVMFPKGTKYSTVYDQYIVNNSARNALGITQTLSLVRKGKTTMVLVRHISHGAFIANELESILGEPVPFLSGKDTSDTRNSTIQGMRDGTVKLLVATTIADEGLDIRPLEALVLLGGGKSSTRALQRVGRVLRTFGNKKNAIVIDFDDKAKFLQDHSKKRQEIYESEPEFIITDV